MKQLYPPQAKVVSEVLLGPKPARALLAFGTGVGKSPTSLSILGGLPGTILASGRILIICPAIVRVYWQCELREWFETDSAVIDVGITRKLSKVGAMRRAAAYEHRIRIVSYDLLDQLDLGPYAAIIVDEAHNIGNPLSKQSETVHKLCTSNPDAHILMLTATPIPTVVKQVWHPLHLLAPAKWGRPSNTGDVSWTFAHKYCHIIKTEYGQAIGGLRSDAAERLRKDMAPLTHRLTMEDVAPHMPPLNVSPLYTDKANLKFYTDWVTALAEDITHAIILVHHKKLAREIFDAACKQRDAVTYVDGEIPATKRSHLIQQIKDAPVGLLVGTYDSLSTGIRLSWAQVALISEFSSSPGTTAQVLGRFASVANASRTMVQVVIRPEDESAQGRLFDRVSKANTVLRSSGNEAAIIEFATERVLSDNQISTMMLTLLGDFNDESEGWDVTE